MTTWLSNSATSNKLKQTYVRGFIDVSGDVIIRNNNELNFYDNNTATKNFSINSQEISVYENGSYVDISNTKLTYIKDLSENVQAKLNEFQSKLGDISHNIDTDYAINIVSNNNLVQINDSLKTNSIEANADVSLNNNVFIGGTTTVDGNIIPSTGFTYDLGSEGNPFGSLYISNNTIFFQGDDNESSGSMKFDAGDITILKRGDPESNRKKLTTSSTGNKLGIGKDSRDAEADLDVSGDSILRGNVTVSDNLVVNGNLRANYSDNSIPVAAIDGNLGLTVSTIKGDTADKIISDVNVLRFDTDSGFDIDDLSNGAVKVKMNSTFKTWKVEGQQDLVAEGLDSMTLVAGDNVVLTTYQDPKSLEIDVDFSNVDTSLNLKANKREVDASFNLKSDKTYVDASLNLKSDKTYMDASLNLKSDKTYVDASFNLKSDKTYVDASLNLKSDKTYVDTSLNLKLPVSNPTVDGLLIVKNGDVSLNQGLNVGGNTKLDGDVSIHGNLSVFQTENNTIINTTVNNYELIVSEDLSLNGNLSVSNNSVFNKNVDICGNLYAQYPDNSIPLSAISDIETKANLSYVDASLNLKADKTYVDASLNLKADKTYVDASLNLKLPVLNPSVQGNLIVSNTATIKGDISVDGDAMFENTYINNILNISGGIFIDGLRQPISREYELFDTFSVDSVNEIKDTQNSTSIFYSNITAFSGNGKCVAFQSSGTYRLFIYKKGTNDWSLTREIAVGHSYESIKLNYDGTRLVGSNPSLNSNKGIIRIYDTSTGDILYGITGSGNNQYYGRTVAISGNGSVIIYTGNYNYTSSVSYYANNNTITYSDTINANEYRYIDINYSGSIFAGVTYDRLKIAVVRSNGTQLGTHIQMNMNDGIIKLSDDGYAIALSSGANVYIYHYVNNDWSQKGSTLYVVDNSYFIFNKNTTNSLQIYSKPNMLLYKYENNDWILTHTIDIDGDRIGLSDQSGLYFASDYYDNSVGIRSIRIVNLDDRDYILNDYIDANYARVRGNAIIDGSLNVLNDASFNGRVDICGNFYAQYPDSSIPPSAINGDIGVNADKDLSLNKALNVGGVTTIDSSLIVKKEVNLSSNLTVDGDVSLNSNMSLGGNLTLSGDLTMDGTLSVRQTESVMNTVVNNYEVIMTNDLSINGNMVISGDTSFNNHVDICGNLYAQYPNESIPPSAIIGGINVDKNVDLNLNAGLNVIGDSSFSYVNVDNSMNVKDLFVDGSMFYNDIVLPINKKYELFDTYSITSFEEITNNISTGFEKHKTVFSGDGSCVAYQYSNGNNTIYIFKKDASNNWSLVNQISENFSCRRMGINYDGTRIIVNNYSYSNSKGIVRIYDTDTGATVNTFTSTLNYEYGRTSAISGDGNVVVYSARALYKDSVVYVGYGSDITYTDTYNSDHYKSVSVNYDGRIFAGITYDGSRIAVLRYNSGSILQLGSHITKTAKYEPDTVGLKLSDDGYAIMFHSGGSIYIYHYINNDWSQKGSTIALSGTSFTFNKNTTNNLQIYKSPNMYLYTYQNNDWVLTRTVDTDGGNVGLPDQHGMNFATEHYNDSDNIRSIKITSRDEATFIQHEYSDTKDLRVRGKTIIDGSLNVINNASFNGRVDICGNFYAQYPANSIPASAIIGPGINTDTDLSLNAGLNVGGVTTIDSSLNVKKEVALSSTLGVAGDVSLDSNLSLNGDMSLNGNLTLGGDLTMDGTLSVRQTQSVMNTVVNNYEVIITNDLSLNGDMSISGNSSFQNNVDICGNLYAQYPNESIPSSAIIGGITVDRDVDLNLNAGLNVIGDSSFSYVNIDNSMNVKDLFVDGSMFYNDIVLPINKKHELLDTYSTSSIGEITNNISTGFEKHKTVFSGDGSCVAYQYSTNNKNIYIFKKNTNNNWGLVNQISENFSCRRMGINYDGTRIIVNDYSYSNSKGIVRIYDTDTGATVNTFTSTLNYYEYGRSSAISGDGNVVVFSARALYNDSVVYVGYGSNITYTDTYNSDYYKSVSVNYNGRIFAGITYDGSRIAVLRYNSGSIVQLGSHITKSARYEPDTVGLKLSDDGYAIMFHSGGSIYIYHYVNNNWSQKGSTIPLAGNSFTFNKNTTNNLQIYKSPNMYLYTYQNNDWFLTRTVNTDGGNFGSPDQHGLNFATEHYNDSDNIRSIKITSRDERTFIQHEYSETKDLRVRGKTIIDGSLNVIDDASFNGRVDICGNFYAQYPDSSIPPSAIDGVVGLDNNADISLNANMVIDGTTNLNSSLSVDGPTVLSSTLNVSKSASLSSTLYVSKATTLNSTLLVRNDATFDTNANIKGNLIVDGDLSVRQTNSVMNTVVNNYEVIITNDLSLNGNAVVSGDASFNGRVDIYGNLYAQYPNNSIPTTAIDGDVGLDTNSDLTLNANLSVGGNATFNNRVDICGNIYAQYPANSIPPSAIVGGVVTEASVFNPNTTDLSLNNNLYVNGDASFNSDVSIKGAMTSTNDVSLNGDLIPVVIPGTDHYRLTSDLSNVALTAYNIPQANSVNYSVRFIDIINYSRFTYVNGNTIYYVKKNSDGTWQRDYNASTQTDGFNQKMRYVFSPDGQYLIAWFENGSNNYKWDICIFDATNNSRFDRSTNILRTISSSSWDSSNEYIDLAVSERSEYNNNDPIIAVATNKNRVFLYRFDTSSSQPNLSRVATIYPPSVSSVNFNYPEQTPGFDITNSNNNYFGYSNSLNDYRVAISKNGRMLFISVQNVGVYIYKDATYTTTIRGYYTDYSGGIDTNKPIRVNDDGTIFAISRGIDSTVHRYNETDDVWYQLGSVITGEIRSMNGFGNIIIVKNNNVYTLRTFNFTTNVWEVTSNLNQTHHTDINGIGNMIIYRGPSQIPEDTNNSLVGILEAPSYTTEYIYNYNFVPSKLFVNGDISVNYNLNVGLDASFGNDVDICGNLTIGKNVIIDGELQVRKSESIMNTVVNNYEVIVTNDLSLNGNLTVSGNSTFNNNLDICGNLYAQYPDNSIPTTAIDGIVGVDTESDLSLNANLFVGSDVSFNSNAYIGNKLFVSGDTSFNSRVDICGNFYAQYPDNSIPSSAIVGGASGVNPFEDASFNKNVDVCGNFYAQYPDSSIPPSAIIGGVLGQSASFNPNSDDLSLNNNLYVNGDASFNSDVSVKGIITATNDISFSGVTPIPIPGTDHYRLTSDLTNVALTAYNIPQANSVNYSVRFIDIINYSRFTYVNGNTIYYVKKNSDGTWQRDYNASTQTDGFNQKMRYVFSPDGQYLIAWFENGSNNYKWDIGVFDATNHSRFDRSTNILRRLSSSNWDADNEYVDLAVSAAGSYNNYPIVAVATRKNKVFLYEFDTSSSPPSFPRYDLIYPPSVSSVNFNYPEQTPGFDITNSNNNYFGYANSLNDYRVAISKNGRVLFISVQNVGVYIYRDKIYTTTIRGYYTNYSGGIDTNKPIRVSDDGTIFALDGGGSYWSVHRYNETDNVWYQLGGPITGEILSMNGFGNIIIVKNNNVYTLRTFNFTTNVWEVTSNLDQTHHTDINGIGNMIVYRGPSQIPEDTNNSLVGILEAPSYTTEYINAVEFKKSNLFVNGDVSINYNLNVGSDASFGNDVDICGNLTIGKNVVIDGELQVRKTESIMNTVVNNYEVIVTNDFSLNGDLTVSGNIYAQYPDNSIPTTAIDGTLGIDTESDLSLNANLYVDGDATFNNRVDIYGNLYAQYPNNSIPVSALNGNVGVDTESDLSLNAKLSVGQDASFNANVSVLGDLTIDGTLQVRETESVMNTVVNNYEVIITNDLSLNGGLSINGDASFNNNVDISGNLIVSKNLSLEGYSVPDTDNIVGMTLTSRYTTMGFPNVYSSSSYRSPVALGHFDQTNSSYVDDYPSIIYYYEASNEYNMKLLGKYRSGTNWANTTEITGFVNTSTAYKNFILSYDSRFFLRQTNSNVIEIYKRPSNTKNQNNSFHTQLIGSINNADGTMSISDNNVLVTRDSTTQLLRVYSIDENSITQTHTINNVSSLTYHNGSSQTRTRTGYWSGFISGDGKTIVANMSYYGLSIFRLVNNDWVYDVTIKENQNNIVIANYAINAKGNYIIYTTYEKNVYVYYYNDQSWSQIGSTLTNGDTDYIAAINRFGTVIAIGGLWNYSPTGMKIYQLINGDWQFFANVKNAYSYINQSIFCGINSNSILSIGVNNNYDYREGFNLWVYNYDLDYGTKHIESKFSISGDASFNGRVDICGNLYAQYPDNSIPVSAINGNIGVDTDSDLSLNAKLSVGQDASFNSNITVLGDSSFNGRVDICGNFYAQYPDNSIPASAIIGGVSSGGNQSVSNLAFGDGNKIIGVTDDVTFDDDDFALIKDSGAINPNLDVSANLYVSGDVSFNNGSVLIPTPLTTDISNTAINIGYLEGMGYITASGLLRQFEP